MLALQSVKVTSCNENEMKWLQFFSIATLIKPNVFHRHLFSWHTLLVRQVFRLSICDKPTVVILMVLCRARLKMCINPRLLINDKRKQ